MLDNSSLKCYTGRSTDPWKKIINFTLCERRYYYTLTYSCSNSTFKSILLFHATGILYLPIKEFHFQVQCKYCYVLTFKNSYNVFYGSQSKSLPRAPVSNHT